MREGSLSDPDSSSQSPAAACRVTTIPGDALEQPRRFLANPLKWKQGFTALRHQNYRLFFFGQAVSLTGTWMQLMAEGWLVYELTQSTLALGAIRFLHTIPVTLFVVFAGMAADRWNKRRILIWTQVAAMALAFLLFLLASTGWIKLWHIGLLAFGLGMAHAFDIPARQSFVVDMVGKRDLMNAIALNSSLFNGARIVGPAVGGVIVGLFSVAACFLINALSFGAVIVSYLRMKLPAPEKPARRETPQASIREALRIIVAHPLLRSVLLLVATVSLFALPYAVLMPVFAGEILEVGATGFGLLLSVNGVGAFLGAVTLAFLGDSPRKLRLVKTGLLGLSLSLGLFALSRNIWLSSVALAWAGWFMIVFFSTANTVVQLSTPDAVRGRVMGIYTFCFIGLSPLGSLAAGLIARWKGPAFTLALGTSICLAIALIVARRLRDEQK